MRRGRIILLVVAVLFIWMAFCSSAYAAPKVLKLSHQWAKGDIRDLWAVKWAGLVKEKTNGALQIKIYPAASLYKPKQQHDAMAKGALDTCVLPHIYLSGKLPVFMITSMPCLVRTTAQGAYWGRHEIGNKLQEISIKNGFRNLSWGCILGSVGSKKTPVYLPKHLKGLKMRGAGKAMEKMLHAGGASIISMPSTEVYFSLQTGTLDAMTTTYSSFMSFRLYEVLDHLAVSKGYSIFYAHHGILIANKTWDRLTKAEQKAVTEAGREVEPYFLNEAEKLLDQTIKVFGDKGVKIHDLTEEEFNKWHELSKKSAYQMYAEKVKGGKELLSIALEAK